MCRLPPISYGTDTLFPYPTLFRSLLFSVPLLRLVAAGLYWLSLAGKVSTDNSYVQQDMVTVSGEVGGQIVEIFVREGDEVAAGQVLFRLDPEPYRIALAQAPGDPAGPEANVIAPPNSSATTGLHIPPPPHDTGFSQATRPTPG